jgi:heme A synthase
MDMSPRGKGRLVTSLAVLVLLALLVWRTMEPGKLQYVTWLLLGFFGFRIVLTWLRTRYSSDKDVVAS